MHVIRIIGISGSLRTQSFNSALLRAAAAAVPSDVDFEIRPIRDIPLFDQDQEDSDGIPPVVAELQEAIAGSAGLVIATPEYNGGMPGVLKNAIDWISRPPADEARILYGKPVALLGATPGGFGTAFAQSAWLPVLRNLRMRLWVDHGPFYVSNASEMFDDAGGLSDEKVRSRLAKYMHQFVEKLR